MGSGVRRAWKAASSERAACGCPLANDFTSLSDFRASKKYRLLTAR